MKNHFRRAVAGLAITLVLCVVGCRKEDFSLIFSHENHVVEREAECSVCHQPAAEGAMGMPKHAACMNCHEIDEENPSEACLQCHKAKSAAEIKMAYGKKPAPKEIAFSHEMHTYMDAKCADCHVRAAASSKATDNVLPPKHACLKCHDDETASLKECGVCHVESSPVNATHKQDWDMRHGLESRFGSSKCLICHQEDTCIKCHQDQKPRDHNNTWRVMTHGAEAAWNRSRCMVCHQEDFCERCHRNTEPRSHRGGWASGPTRHCMQCHFPTGSAGCSVCHKEADHNTASFSPHPPFEGFDCSFCHPAGDGIPPHPYPPAGTPCTVCHER